MWKSLIFLAILANLLLLVTFGSCEDVKDTHTVITTITNTTSNAAVNVTADGGNVTAAAGASAMASVITIIKTHQHTLKKCANHEKYVRCPTRLCQPQICEHVGFPLCSSHGIKYQHSQVIPVSYQVGAGKNCYGPPACVCIDDYVRNADGVCIPINDCPACGGDRNATFGCGINCGRRCSNYNKENVTCADIDVCYVNSCDCKEGYVLDDNTGKCVLPEDCSEVPLPDSGEGTPDDGENSEGGPCDNCTGDCVQPEEPEGEEVEGGGTTQNQCPTDNTSEEEEPSEEEGEDDDDDEDILGEGENTSPVDVETTTKAEEVQDPCTALYPNSILGCDKTCKQLCPNIEPRPCKKCKKSSCMCVNGYLYDYTTNKCVLPDDCAMEEPEEPEVTTKTPSPSTATTKKPQPTTTKSSAPTTSVKPIKRRKTKKPKKSRTTTTVPDVEDPTDPITPRTGGGIIDPAEDCNKKNEKYYKCGNSCHENTCEDYMNRNVIKCNRNRGVNGNCEPGCRCEKKYYRNSWGNCVEGSTCRRTTGITPIKSLPVKIGDPATCGTDILNIYVKANIGLTAKILLELSLLNEGSNVMCGGYSLLNLLAVIKLFSSGSSLLQLQAIIDLNLDQITCLLPKINNAITTDILGGDLDVVTNILADDKCKFTDKFTNLLEDILDILPLNLDLGDLLSANIISEVVSILTKNNILDFVTSELLSTLDGITLLDALSFNGEFKHKFNPKNTKLSNFYAPNNVLVKKKMMYQRNKFYYGEDRTLGCQIVKIPYKNTPFNLIVYLPNLIDGINDLLQNLLDVDAVLAALAKLRLVNLDLYLPIINTKSSNKLKEALIQANLDTIFNIDVAGLLDVVTCALPVVSDVLQTVTLTVSELGSGVLDLVSGLLTSLPIDTGERVKIFRANHPFAYALCYGDIVVFAGVHLL